ncbi:MAG: diheme cytochrome c precursor [Pirellulales bacterium]
MGLFLSVVIGIAVVGFFVGINDGVPREEVDHLDEDSLTHHSLRHDVAAEDVAPIPATHYADMRRTETGPTSRWQPTIEPTGSSEYDPSIEIKPSEEEKRQSLQTRASRRAFNGAPPVIPHGVERTDDAACYACHGQGARIGDLVANQMSHGFLANCTQCHAPPPPKPFAGMDTAVENSFVGVSAPMQGERAYPGAPPTIPHSRWMRENCTACHGLEGWAGMESTHPWRTNCTQCHAPSATLDQAVSATPIPMLPPLNTEEE